MLPLLIIANIAYIAFALSECRKHRMSHDLRVDDDALPPSMKFIFCGGFPLVVTVTMTYFFLIVGGATTVQFNVGSTSAMNVWRTWVHVWPIFMFITLACSIITLIWMITCFFRKSLRSSIPVSSFSFLLSIFTWITVASYFPSA